MGKKRLRNIPILHDQVKKKRTIALTDTAYEAMSEAARSENISLSEFVERWARQINLPCRLSSLL